MAKYTEGNHAEIPDQTPVELPLGYTEPESLAQMIARMIHAEDFRKSQEAQGMESFEEADDFNVDDDLEFTSEHEMSQMQEEYVKQRNDEVVAKTDKSVGMSADREQSEDSEEEHQEEPSEVSVKKRASGKKRQSVAST